MSPNMSLFSVNAVLILAADDSSRILAKYYSPPHAPANATANDFPGANPYPQLKDQKAFEKGLLEKTAKQNSDIVLYDNRVVVFKMESDVMLYVVGGADENEILLYSVVLALRDSLNILLKCVILQHSRWAMGTNTLIAETLSTSAQSSRTTTLCPWPSTRSSTTVSCSRRILSSLRRVLASPLCKTSALSRALNSQKKVCSRPGSLVR